MPWPDGSGAHGGWPTADPPSRLARPLADLLARALDPAAGLGETRAVAVVLAGRLVAEGYAGRTDAFGTEGDPVGPATPLLSWSMAKSMLHATIGLLVGDGRLDTAEPVGAPEWPDHDPRRAITVEHCLAMRDGLDFAEDYDPDAAGGTGTSHVIEMLFGPAAADVAAFAASRPAAHPPGEVFNYSSGTSNLVSRAVRDRIGGGPAYRALLHDRLFGPLGMTSATPGFDEAGTWVASSYVHATARDLARFGLWYLRDGVWDGRRLLPEGWVDHGRRARSVDPDDGRLYGAHWWVVGDDHGTFWANGYEGQSILVSPGLDLVVVRLGKSSAEQYPALARWRADVVAAVADAVG